MLIRVFIIPNDLSVGYLFSGGTPHTFVQVDWFRDDNGWSKTPAGRAELKQFIKTKRYYVEGLSYLVLHPTHPFTIGCEAP